MTGPATRPQFHGSALDMPDARAAAEEMTRLWWIWLVSGIAWILASVVILQFDAASVTTIGVIVGIMFVFAGAQQLVLAAIAESSLRWVLAFFGVVFLIAGGIAMFNPEDTFAGLADILGFCFLFVGVSWIIRGFLERPVNPVWWLGLISGALMIVLAFWTGGQFFLEKAYTLLVFAGIWAMLHGVTDLIRAFQVRGLRDAI